MECTRPPGTVGTTLVRVQWQGGLDVEGSKENEEPWGAPGPDGTMGRFYAESGL